MFYFPLTQTSVWTRLQGGGRDVSLMCDGVSTPWRPAYGHVHSSDHRIMEYQLGRDLRDPLVQPLM